MTWAFICAQRHAGPPPSSGRSLSRPVRGTRGRRHRNFRHRHQPGSYRGDQGPAGGPSPAKNLVHVLPSSNADHELEYAGISHPVLSRCCSGTLPACGVPRRRLSPARQSTPPTPDDPPPLPESSTELPEAQPAAQSAAQSRRPGSV